MVGIDMGFEDPGEVEVGFADESDDRIGRGGICPAAGKVEIQHGIDDGAAASFGVADDI